MHHIIFSSASCPTSPYINSGHHKWRDLRGGGDLSYIEWVFWFSVQFCQKYFLFYEELSDILSQIGIYLHVQLRFLFDFNENKIFLLFLKNNQTLSFMIIHLVEAQLFHEDRQTQRRTEDSWTGSETDRQTDRHYKDNSCFPQLFEHS
jgi:hypothetical protein